MGLFDKGATATTEVQIPDELKPIYSTLGNQWSAAMQANPMMGPEMWWGKGKDTWDYGEGPFGSQNNWQYPGSRLRDNPLDTYDTDPTYTYRHIEGQPIPVRPTHRALPGGGGGGGVVRALPTGSTSTASGIGAAQGIGTKGGAQPSQPSGKGGASTPGVPTMPSTGASPQHAVTASRARRAGG